MADLVGPQMLAETGGNSWALDWLEKGCVDRDPNKPYLSTIPVLDCPRDEKRLQGLLRRMGLPQ